MSFPVAEKAQTKPFFKHATSSDYVFPTTLFIHEQQMIESILDLMQETSVESLYKLIPRNVMKYLLIPLFLNIEVHWKPLLKQCSKRYDEQYSLYLSSLPKLSQLKSFPVLYNSEERELVKGVPLEFYIEQHHEYYAYLYHSFFVPTVKHLAKKLQASNSFCKLPEITYNEYQWGILMQFSRGFGSDNTVFGVHDIPMLIPVMDFFNTPGEEGETANVVNNLHIDNDKTVWYQMITSKRVSKGDQLLFQYHSQLANSDWLYMYGFCSHLNKDNVVFDITKNLPKKKLKLLSQVEEQQGKPISKELIFNLPALSLIHI